MYNQSMDFFVVSMKSCRRLVFKKSLGDYVEVAVYNVPAEAAMQLYCKGRVLSIAKPCYKIRADGTGGTFDYFVQVVKATD